MTPATPETVRAALLALVEAVEEDKARHGGTLSRTTLQKASLARLEISRLERKGPSQ